MSSTTASSPYTVQTEKIAARRLLWVGPLAIVVAVIANGIVRAIKLAVLDISPQFTPLASPTFVPFTIVGVLGATIAFAIVARLSKRPVWLFNRVAVVVLILSFLPDLSLLGGAMPGATGSGVIALMVMHVVAAIISVGLLTRLTREK